MEENNIKNDTQLASILGWKQSATSQRLSGDLSIKTLETLSKLFKVTVKEFLR